MQLRLGQSRILVWLENIVIVTLNSITCFSIQIHIHLAVLHIVERPYIIQSSNMVAVGMGDEYGIQVTYIFAQHLLPKIGTNVEQDVPAIDSQKSRRTKTPIA